MNMKRFKYFHLIFFTILNFLCLLKVKEVFQATSEKVKIIQYPSVKLGGVEADCAEDPACGPDCQVCCELPYNKETGKLEVHHYFTQRGLWNAGEREKNIPLSPGSTIMYPGGNTDGADGLYFMKQCPQCKLHIYEPVPDFYGNLEKVWSDHLRTNQWDVTVHKYGLGDSTRTILLSEADLKGQGTFGMKDNEADEGKKIPLEIIDASTVFSNVTGGLGDLDLLHVNCEGCEYEMLENIIKSGLHWKIKIIQFGTHFFPEVPRLTQRYCTIRSELSQSHRMIYGTAFAWERWDRKL